MKLINKLFHKMMNESVKFQGCFSIHMGMAKDLDVPGLLLTVRYINHISFHSLSYLVYINHKNALNREEQVFRLNHNMFL